MPSNEDSILRALLGLPSEIRQAAGDMFRETGLSDTGDVLGDDSLRFVTSPWRAANWALDKGSDYAITPQQQHQGMFGPVLDFPRELASAFTFGAVAPHVPYSNPFPDSSFQPTPAPTMDRKLAEDPQVQQALQIAQQGSGPRPFDGGPQLPPGGLPATTSGRGGSAARRAVRDNMPQQAAAQPSTQNEAIAAVLQAAQQQPDAGTSEHDQTLAEIRQLLRGMLSNQQSQQVPEYHDPLQQMSKGERIFMTILAGLGGGLGNNAPQVMLDRLRQGAGQDYERSRQQMLDRRSMSREDQSTNLQVLQALLNLDNQERERLRQSKRDQLEGQTVDLGAFNPQFKGLPPVQLGLLDELAPLLRLAPDPNNDLERALINARINSENASAGASSASAKKTIWEIEHPEEARGRSSTSRGELSQDQAMDNLRLIREQFRKEKFARLPLEERVKLSSSDALQLTPDDEAAIRLIYEKDKEMAGGAQSPFAALMEQLR